MNNQQYLSYLKRFARERRLYHKRMARRNPEEYPDYNLRKRKEKENE